MSWYKKSQKFHKNQKDYHRSMVIKYIRDKMDAEKNLHKYEKNKDEAKIEEYNKKVEKIDKLLEHHYEQILYYTRQEEKEKLKEETGVELE